MRRNDYLWTSG